MNASHQHQHQPSAGREIAIICICALTALTAIAALVYGIALFAAQLQVLQGAFK